MVSLVSDVSVPAACAYRRLALPSQKLLHEVLKHGGCKATSTWLDLEVPTVAVGDGEEQVRSGKDMAGGIAGKDAT